AIFMAGHAAFTLVDSTHFGEFNDPKRSKIVGKVGMAKLAAEDKDFAALKHAVFDQTPTTHSAYYFAEWPAVHKAYSDMAIAALSGKREDIPKVLAEHADKIHRAATRT